MEWHKSAATAASGKNYYILCCASGVFQWIVFEILVAEF